MPTPASSKMDRNSASLSRSASCVRFCSIMSVLTWSMAVGAPLSSQRSVHLLETTICVPVATGLGEFSLPPVRLPEFLFYVLQGVGRRRFQEVVSVLPERLALHPAIHLLGAFVPVKDLCCAPVVDEYRIVRQVEELGLPTEYAHLPANRLVEPACVGDIVGVVNDAVNFWMRQEVVGESLRHAPRPIAVAPWDGLRVNAGPHRYRAELLHDAVEVIRVDVGGAVGADILVGRVPKDPL